MSPVVLDGFSRARSRARTGGLSTARLEAIVERARSDERWHKAQRRAGGPRLRLDAGPVARVLVGTSSVRLEFPTRAHVVLADYVEVQVHAPEAWSRGASCLTAWCATVSRELGAVGPWRVTGVELCRDLQAVPFAPADLQRITGRARRDVVDIGGAPTLYYGRRASEESICIYDKPAQAAAVKSCDLETYTPTHRACGWDGWAPISRVELRLSGRALDCAGANLRDPEAWHDDDIRNGAWRGALERHRLVCDDATRRTRCETDPRWLLAMDVSGRPLRQARADPDPARADARAGLVVLAALAAVAARNGDATPDAALARLAREWGDDWPARLAGERAELASLDPVAWARLFQPSS